MDHLDGPELVLAEFVGTAEIVEFDLVFSSSRMASTSTLPLERASRRESISL
jgi:hypothetical protein